MSFKNEMGQEISVGMPVVNAAGGDIGRVIEIRPYKDNNSANLVAVFTDKPKNILYGTEIGGASLHSVYPASSVKMVDVIRSSNNRGHEFRVGDRVARLLPYGGLKYRFEDVIKAIKTLQTRDGMSSRFVLERNGEDSGGPENWGPSDKVPQGDSQVSQTIQAFEAGRGLSALTHARTPQTKPDVLRLQADGVTVVSEQFDLMSFLNRPYVGLPVWGWATGVAGLVAYLYFRSRKS